VFEAAAAFFVVPPLNPGFTPDAFHFDHAAAAVLEPGFSTDFEEIRHGISVTYDLPAASVAVSHCTADNNKRENHQ
jgi:hypothetical protein